MLSTILRTVARAARLPVAAPAPPCRLGVSGGRLADGPDRPNWVSSQTDRRGHLVEPLWRGGGRQEAVAAVRRAVTSEPGVRLVVEREGYLHAEITTPVWRFVDDVEVLWSEGVLHVRSGSRVGHSDLGANRARVERIRRRMAGPEGRSPGPAADQ